MAKIVSWSLDREVGDKLETVKEKTPPSHWHAETQFQPAISTPLSLKNDLQNLDFSCQYRD